MTPSGGDLRSAALEAYLERRRAQGFSIETRTRAQAVIVRRHRFYLVLRVFARARAEQRLVVSVDEHGAVTSLAAEPVRW